MSKTHKPSPECEAQYERQVEDLLESTYRYEILCGIPGTHRKMPLTKARRFVFSARKRLSEFREKVYRVRVARGTCMPLGGWKAREQYAARLRYLREIGARDAAIEDRDRLYHEQDAHAYIGKGWKWREKDTKANQKASA